jgi:hypothetical protein
VKHFIPSPGALYVGERKSGPRGEVLERVVTVDGRRLTPDRSQAVRFCSGGFEWGYTGASASQLALALVLDATNDEHLALCSYSWIKHAVVACWGDEWEITAREIVRWVEQWRTEAAIRQQYAERAAREAEIAERVYAPVSWTVLQDRVRPDIIAGPDDPEGRGV